MNLARRQQITIGFFAIFLLGIAVGWGIFQKPQAKVNISAPAAQTAGKISEKNDLDLKNLFEVWKILQEKYLDTSKLSRETLSSYAVKGLVLGLKDPYTVYMDPEESKEFEAGLNSQLEGIGAQLEIKEGKLVIVAPLKNSPAEKAGLKADDVILKINSAEASEMTLLEAVSKIRGKKGTQVTLTIARENILKPFDITITRSNIEIESVTVTEPKSGIFLLQINQFSDDTEDEFLKAVNEILLKKPTGVILDFRYNGGGYLDIAVEMLSAFLPEKTIAVKIRKRAPAEDEIIRTEGQTKLPDTPLAVLANKGSASASEIVAGALQDYKRAVVIGEKTFGKGSVQEIENLKDGSSLRMTVAEWLTPLGRSIDKVGIIPDKEVKSPENALEGEDPQLDEAIRYLKNPKL